MNVTIEVGVTCDSERAGETSSAGDEESPANGGETNRRNFTLEISVGTVGAHRAVDLVKILCGTLVPVTRTLDVLDQRTKSIEIIRELGLAKKARANFKAVVIRQRARNLCLLNTRNSHKLIPLFGCHPQVRATAYKY